MRIDKLRKKYFGTWKYCQKEKKIYVLVFQSVVCKSKQQRGLGIIDLGIMNKLLLLKWIIRFKDPQCVGIWKNIIIVKYSNRRNFVSFSPFWKGVIQLLGVVEISLNKVVGDESIVFFWLFRRNKIMRKANFLKRGWSENTSCVFFVIYLKPLIIYLCNVQLLE